MSKYEINRKLREFDYSNIDLKSDASTRWFANNLSKIRTQMRPENYIKSNPSAFSHSGFLEGSMLFFRYSPKTKDKLDFWDEFPLVFMLSKQGKSFLGVNLHYLNYKERAGFLNYMIKSVDNPEYYKNPPAYINYSYQQLNKSRMKKSLHKCIKQYHLECIISRVNVVPSNEWKFTSFLPIDRFKGANREDVWKENK